MITPGPFTLLAKIPYSASSVARGPVRRRRREVRARVAVQPGRAAPVAAVEPDLVAAAAGTQEVADGEVLDAHAVGLEHLDAVATGGGSRRSASDPGPARRDPTRTAAEPGRVPSTTTWLRSMPRTWMPGFVIMTPPVASSAWPSLRVVGPLVVIAGPDEDPVAGISPRRPRPGSSENWPWRWCQLPTSSTRGR